MRKVLTLLAALGILASCSSPLGMELSTPQTGEDRALAVPVLLVKAESYSRAHYGISSVDRAFTIKVQNLSPVKSVAVHHKNIDGTWTDLPASYQGPAEEGYEFWTVRYDWTIYYGQSYTLDTKFAVKMEANGQTYLDNNLGADYNLATHGGVLLGRSVNVLQTAANGYRGWADSTNVSFYGTVSVRNLGYQKAVKIVYTTDAWATTKVANASYVPYYYVSYGGAITSPNEAGTEPWSWSIEIPLTQSEGFEYAIAYEVGGVTYWDNNCGKNFKKSDLVK